MSQAKIVFNDGERVFANAKALRAWVRKQGLSVRDGHKTGNTYWLDCDAPAAQVLKPVRVADARPQPFLKSEPTPMPCVDIGSLSGEPVGGTRKVLGKDLEPLDTIFGHFPVPLTIDYAGVRMISPPRPANLPSTLPDRVPFLGFYSMESGSMLSYQIHHEMEYEVVANG